MVSYLRRGRAGEVIETVAAGHAAADADTAGGLVHDRGVVFAARRRVGRVRIRARCTRPSTRRSSAAAVRVCTGGTSAGFHRAAPRHRARQPCSSTPGTRRRRVRERATRTGAVAHRYAQRDRGCECRSVARPACSPRSAATATPAGTKAGAVIVLDIVLDALHRTARPIGLGSPRWRPHTERSGPDAGAPRAKAVVGGGEHGALPQYVRSQPVGRTGWQVKPHASAVPAQCPTPCGPSEGVCGPQEPSLCSTCRPRGKLGAEGLAGLDREPHRPVGVAATGTTSRSPSSTAHTRRPTSADTSMTSTTDPVARSTEYGRSDHQVSTVSASRVASVSASSRWAQDPSRPRPARRSTDPTASSCREYRPTVIRRSNALAFSSRGKPPGSCPTTTLRSPPSSSVRARHSGTTRP